MPFADNCCCCCCCCCCKEWWWEAGNRYPRLMWAAWPLWNIADPPGGDPRTGGMLLSAGWVGGDGGGVEGRASPTPTALGGVAMGRGEWSAGAAGVGKAGGGPRVGLAVYCINIF